MYHRCLYTYINQYIYMYPYIYTCIYLYIYIRVFQCEGSGGRARVHHRCLYNYTHLYVYIHTYIYIQIDICTHKMYIRICICIHICTCASIHMYARAQARVSGGRALLLHNRWYILLWYVTVHIVIHIAYVTRYILLCYVT